MKWDIEERTEDALVSYLRTQATGDMRFYSAWDMTEPQLPCAVVHAGESMPVSEQAEWHDARKLNVSIAVQTEAADEVDSSGNVVMTARARNARARSDVIGALATTGLLTQLNAQGIESVSFSMAQLVGATRTTEGRTLVTNLTLDVIAEPVTGS